MPDHLHTSELEASVARLTARLGSDCNSLSLFYQVLSGFLFVACVLLAVAVCRVHRNLTAQAAALHSIHHFLNVPASMSLKEGGTQRDQLVKVIKFLLDQYLKHVHPDTGSKHTHGHLLTFPEEPPMAELLELRELVSEQDLRERDPTAFSPDMRAAYREAYDLNLLTQKMQNNEPIVRSEVDFADKAQVQFFLRQLKQMLHLIQNASTEHFKEVLLRAAALQQMRDLDSAKASAAAIVAKHQNEEQLAPEVLANMKLIKLVVQVLTAIEADHAQMKAMVEKQEAEAPDTLGLPGGVGGQEPGKHLSLQLARSLKPGGDGGNPRRPSQANRLALPRLSSTIARQ